MWMYYSVPLGTEAAPVTPVKQKGIVPKHSKMNIPIYTIYNI